jgi:hypothetical protein
MNRLIRIALTLFVSGTLLVFLAQKRLARLEGILSSEGKSGNVENEIQMVYLGVCMAGVMLIAGLALIVTAVVRSRKKNHG